MSARDTQSAPVLRCALATVVIADLVSLWFFLGDARGRALADGIVIGGFTELFSRTTARGVVVLFGIAGAVAFARKPGRLWEGLVPLVALMLLSSAHAQLFGSPWRHLFFSGVCLTGWLVGLAVSRRAGAPTDESYARMGSLALLGAAYLNSGISKIVYGGFDWLSGFPIQAVIVGQDGLATDGIVSPYRLWVVTTPAVAALFSMLTVSFELAGPLMIVGRRIRLAVALGLLTMHTIIFILTPVLYWESMVLLIVFGFSRDPLPSERTPESVPAVLSNRRTFATAAGLLAIGAVLAIGFQGLRASIWHGHGGGPGTPPPLTHEQH